MAIKWITHNCWKILYVDYRECETELDLISLFDESASMIVSQPGKVRLLSNFKGISVGSEYMNRVKIASTNMSRSKLEKTAIIGVGGFISILVDGYFRTKGDKNSKVFETMEEGLDWLANV